MVRWHITRERWTSPGLSRRAAGSRAASFSGWVSLRGSETGAVLRNGGGEPAGYRRRPGIRRREPLSSAGPSATG